MLLHLKKNSNIRTSKYTKNKLIWYDINRTFEHTLAFDPTYINPKDLLILNILLKKCSYCELLESVKRECRTTALVIH